MAGDGDYRARCLVGWLAKEAPTSVGILDIPWQQRALGSLGPVRSRICPGSAAVRAGRD